MFIGKLREVLEAELAAGNRIQEEWAGNWPLEQCRVILLKMPFQAPIRKDMNSIEFRNVNDPHYWKAEYYDAANNEFLACGFGGAPDFSEMG
jgi:hypothetical protein